ncbi:MAG: THUMP domain-containing protein [Nitrosarchaeum sp.]|nr:RNA methyltransferase [Nitrosarchaeum sp.]MBP0119637.1 THUMP domain-containing protein [Nitrosarchaeum sp.]MBP0134316.1 THUMP domain-containing protein [Nitrosarchaeum sp.]
MNLIITCARYFELETSQELQGILENLGDLKPIITITDMSGILTVKTKIDSIEVVRKIKEMVLEEPWCIRYSLRIIPIQKIIETNMDSIENGISEIINLLSNEETYRISIEKRNSNISTQELITKIAKKIKNKVSLDFPDKIILIEILGKNTGISIIKNTDILSIEKIKRGISE